MEGTHYCNFKTAGSNHVANQYLSKRYYKKAPVPCVRFGLPCKWGLRLHQCRSSTNGGDQSLPTRDNMGRGERRV